MVKIGNEIKKKIFLKITSWLLYSVFFSLFPLLGSCLLLWTKNKTPAVPSLIGKGELLLIAVTLTANSISGLIDIQTERQLLKKLIFFAAITILMFASLWFGQILSESLSGASFPRTSSWAR